MIVWLSSFSIRIYCCKIIFLNLKKDVYTQWSFGYKFNWNYTDYTLFNIKSRFIWSLSSQSLDKPWRHPRYLFVTNALTRILVVSQWQHYCCDICFHTVSTKNIHLSAKIVFFSSNKILWKVIEQDQFYAFTHLCTTVIVFVIPKRICLHFIIGINDVINKNKWTYR